MDSIGSFFTDPLLEGYIYTHPDFNTKDTEKFSA